MIATLIAAADDGLRWGLLISAFSFGLRHGFDWDHVAAIGDFTGGGNERRRSLLLATLYATGHAAVIVALGSLAVIAGDYIPSTIDSFMGRVIGVTLVVLGGYVIVGLIRHGRNFRMRSRWTVMAAPVRWLRRQRSAPLVVIEHEHDHDHDADQGAGHGHTHPHGAGAEHDVHIQGEGDGHATTAVKPTLQHSHRHVHVGSLPPDPTGPGKLAAVGIGMLHGIGAETPTQVVLFVTAASAAGALTGELVLLAFTVGLFASNTAIAIAASTGFLHAERRFGIYATVATVAAAFSILLGLTYVAGLDLLPALLTG